MDALADHLRQQVQAHGNWIGFDDFMQSALYWPGLGYYTGGGRPFESDYVTAPMLGPWLGQAVWKMSAALRTESLFRIREFGGGRGDLAASFMACAQEEPVPQLKMEMVELSADLAEQQRRTTQGLGPIEWLSRVEEGFTGLVVANEVLDAMPVKRLEWRGDADVVEWGIGLEGDQFVWRERPAAPEVIQAVLIREAAARRRDLPWAPGYCLEWCPWTAPWLASLAKSMETGAVVLIDYGYAERELDHPGRPQGTLCAHYRHQRFDAPEQWIARLGQQDLTAHVNFSQIAREAQQAGFQVSGFVTQARFLMNMGLLDTVQASLLTITDPLKRAKTLQGIKTVLMESEMGEVFKVMLLTKHLPPATCARLESAAFEAGDRRDSLML
ncbi:MAG: hypothetical protein RL676_899 [Pseudomonadota bacterium]|jgi:SAM-dependent MidA family methyltransferase